MRNASAAAAPTSGGEEAEPLQTGPGGGGCEREGRLKWGVSSKAARLGNEALVKKGSAARSSPIPNWGLDVLIALDAPRLPLVPHGLGGPLARD